MAQITKNGITFNSYKDRGGQEIGFSPLRMYGQQGPDEDGGIVNAVDIDWNAAEIPYGDLETGETTTINSTGELLSLVSKMQQEVFVLSAAVAALSESSEGGDDTVLDDNIVVKGSEDSKGAVTLDFNTNYGSVYIDGYNETESGNEYSYRVGTVVNLVATPKIGRTFDHWELNGQEVSTVFNNTVGFANDNKFSFLVYATIDFTIEAVFA